MTITQYAKRARRRAGLGLGLVAAVSALTVGLGAGAAYAATIPIPGSYDVAEIEYDPGIGLFGGFEIGGDDHGGIIDPFDPSAWE
ncbi:MAG: hypothetical protein LBD51_04435 [Bifidobacteriaceae bacterium]|jgi:hypothetical protein|nr:hypothetical protein [Bifidobacteriaceae bacterium]